MSMKTLATAVAALGLAVSIAGASDVVGYVYQTCPGNSEIVVGVPFTRDCVGTYTVTGVSGNTLTVTGAAWASYANTHFVRLTSGAADGQWATITAVSGDDLTLTLDAATAGVVAGDTFKLCPHWTLATLMPDNLAGISFVASANSFPSSRRTEILLPDLSGTGTDRSATKYYYRSGAWYLSGGGNADAVILPPQTLMILRNTNNASELTFVALGDAQDGTSVTGLAIANGVNNDNYVATTSPIDLTLDQLNLGGTAAFVASANSFPSSRRDELILFDNSATGVDKLASGTKYYYRSGAWYLSGGGLAGSTVVPAGSAIVVRKYKGASDTTVNWTRTQDLE